MADQQIICPQCRASIPLTEAISHQIKESTRKDMEADFARRLAAEKAQVQKDAAAAAQQQMGIELKDLQKQVAEKNARLQEAQAAELEMRRKQRELEERQKTMELEIARKLDQERAQISKQVGDKVAAEYHQKMMEAEKQKLDLQRTIDDLKRKAEQGSQQNQGEVVELELEQSLKNAFPIDEIEPVAKGVRGADVIQRVHNKSGHLCGSIIWESKQTKAWQENWVLKLKDDQRAAKADIAVLLSSVLPKNLSYFGPYEGIWVTDQRCVLAVAAVLRNSLIQVTNARAVGESRNEKMELVYNYLSGVEFKQRIEALIDSYILMRDQLDQEKRAAVKSWAVREKHIERAQLSLAGMHGDLKGIIGGSLPNIRSLELDPPPAPKSTAAAIKNAEKAIDDLPF